MNEKISPGMTEVGIAIVEHRGRYLVGVRQPNQELAGKAEFPGGKCHPGESKADCAVRECQEETGVQVRADQLLYQARHSYPHATIQIGFWLCSLNDFETTNFPKPENGFTWEKRAALPGLDFPEANAPVIELLLQQQ